MEFRLPDRLDDCDAFGGVSRAEVVSPPTEHSLFLIILVCRYRYVRIV